MRIAVLSSHTPSLFWFRMEMMESFQSLGYEVYALGNEDESIWAERFAEKNIIYKKIEVERNGINPMKDLKSIVSIRKVLAEIKPDKLFTYQAKTVIYGGIAANLLGITEVYPLIAGMGSVFLKNDLKTKVIRTILKTEYKLGMRKSPAVFFQNNDDKQVFMDNHILSKQKIVMIPGSGVNTKKFQVMELPEEFAFLCISRLIRDKGIYEYLEASREVKKKYPNVRFILVGPYDTNPSAIKPEELQAFIDEGTIEYYGEQTDVRPYLGMSNVFVLPSYREGTPKTNLEAMACGRAVITTDAPGCRETVVNQENGLLVPVKDVKALIETMVYFIEHPNTVSEMGTRGRAMAEEIFDVRIVNKRICDAMRLEK